MQHGTGAEEEGNNELSQNNCRFFFFHNNFLLGNKFIFNRGNGAGCGENTCIAWWLINVVCGLAL